MHFKKQTQIEVQNRTQVKTLLFNKASIKIPAEYSNYSNIFLIKYVAKLLNTKINEYAIKLKKSKQQLFGSIYSLRPVKLETLKTYIKTNLANGFI